MGWIVIVPKFTNIAKFVWKFGIWNMVWTEPGWGRVGWRSGKPRTSRDRDARLALIGIDLIQFESV